MRSFVVLVICLCCSLSYAEGAPALFPLELEHGKLAGSGGDLLRAQLPDAQFILWGEDHGFADSAILLHALAREARAFGFKYHVVEVGPLSTRMIAGTLSRDGLTGLHQLVHEVPLGLPFLSLKEDAELAQDFLGSDEKGEPYLWGVDQEFIGSPSFHLQKLQALAPSDTARNAIAELLTAEKEAAANGAQDKFLLARFHPADFDALAAQFHGQTEAEDIIAQLRESAAIYQLWMSGHNYENNTRRARLLARTSSLTSTPLPSRSPKSSLRWASSTSRSARLPSTPSISALSLPPSRERAITPPYASLSYLAADTM